MSASVPPPMMGWDLRNYIMGMSCLDFSYIPSTPNSKWEQQSQETKDHILLLGGIALLLVSKATGDVSAVSSFTEKQKSWSYTVVYMNNQGFTAEERTYVARLSNLVDDKASPYQISKCAFPHCAEKIVSRCHKAARCFLLSPEDTRPGVRNLMNLRQDDRNHQAIFEQVKESGLVTDGNSFVDRTDGLLRGLAKVKIDTPVEIIIRILAYAYALSNTEVTEQAFPKDQVNLLRKVGDYWKTCLALSRMKATLEKRGFPILKWQCISPPSVQRLEVFKHIIDILNLRLDTNSRLKKIAKWSQISAAYPSARGPLVQGQVQPSKKNIITTRFSQHAELTIADFLGKKFSVEGRKETILLGVSKACCSWYHEYIDLLNTCLAAAGITILYRKAHNKQTAGWMLPPGGPPVVTEQMGELIRQKVDEVFARVGAHRPPSPDSEPQSPEGEVLPNWKLQEVGWGPEGPI